MNWTQRILEASLPPSYTWGRHLKPSKVFSTLPRYVTGDVLQIFIDRGINVNISDQYRWTALMNAAKKGQFTSIKLLIDANANPDIKATFGSTALTLASCQNCPVFVAELLRRGANDKLEEDGKTAQQLAEEEGHQDVVKIFEVFSNKKNINTEMLTAAEENKWRLLRGLIIAGADIQTRDDNGDTALHLGAARGHERMRMR